MAKAADTLPATGRRSCAAQNARSPRTYDMLQEKSRRIVCAQKAAHLLIGELFDGAQLFDASCNAGFLVPFVQFFERFGVPFIAISISFVLQALVGRTCDQADRAKDCGDRCPGNGTCAKQIGFSEIANPSDDGGEDDQDGAGPARRAATGGLAGGCADRAPGRRAV